MPEGDTLRALATRLQPLVGERIVRARAQPRPGMRRVPDLSRLVGARVVSVDARGKHLLIGFDGGLTLRSHLRMRGSWRLVRAGRPSPRPAYRASAVLETERWIAIAYDTPVVDLLTDAGLRRSTPLRTLGPDLLGTTFDTDEALRRLRERGARQLGDALLDQRAVAGIGNVYKSEVAFLEGLDPWAPVAAFTDTQLLATLATARRLLQANVGGGPRSTTGSRGRGRQLWVYGRTGRPCWRCGTPIRSARQGESARLTFWCPRCQPSV